MCTEKMNVAAPPTGGIGVDVYKTQAEIEITPEMIEAGKDVVLIETGGGAGSILSAYFDSASLAKRVYSAMMNVRDGRLISS